MKDLTRDSISVHILTLAAPVIVSTFAQFAYQLVDLYFIAQIGAAATAGANVAANLLVVFVALTQLVIVGTTPLVAQAVGRKDQADADLVFNQSMALSVIIGLVTTALIYACIRPWFPAKYLELPARERQANDARRRQRSAGLRSLAS